MTLVHLAAAWRKLEAAPSRYGLPLLVAARRAPPPAPRAYGGPISASRVTKLVFKSF